MIIRTMLIASEGNMLTDGTLYRKAFIPAEGSDTTAYREITMDEYYEIFPEKKPVEETEEEIPLEMIGEEMPTESTEEEVLEGEGE